MHAAGSLVLVWDFTKAAESQEAARTAKSARAAARRQRLVAAEQREANARATAAAAREAVLAAAEAAAAARRAASSTAAVDSGDQTSAPFDSGSCGVQQSHYDRGRTDAADISNLSAGPHDSGDSASQGSDGNSDDHTSGHCSSGNNAAQQGHCSNDCNVSSCHSSGSCGTRNEVADVYAATDPAAKAAAVAATCSMGTDNSCVSHSCTGTGRSWSAVSCSRDGNTEQLAEHHDANSVQDASAARAHADADAAARHAATSHCKGGDTSAHSMNATFSSDSVGSSSSSRQQSGSSELQGEPPHCRTQQLTQCSLAVLSHIHADCHREAGATCQHASYGHRDSDTECHLHTESGPILIEQQSKTPQASPCNHTSSSEPVHQSASSRKHAQSQCVGSKGSPQSARSMYYVPGPIAHNPTSDSEARAAMQAWQIVRPRRIAVKTQA